LFSYVSKPTKIDSGVALANPNYTFEYICVHWDYIVAVNE